MKTLETYHVFGRFANEPALRLADRLAAMGPTRMPVTGFPEVRDDVVQTHGQGTLDIDPVVLGVTEEVLAPFGCALRAPVRDQRTGRDEHLVGLDGPARSDQLVPRAAQPLDLLDRCLLVKGDAEPRGRLGEALGELADVQPSAL